MSKNATTNGVDRSEEFVQVSAHIAQILQDTNISTEATNDGPQLRMAFLPQEDGPTLTTSEIQDIVEPKLTQMFSESSDFDLADELTYDTMNTGEEFMAVFSVE